MGRFVSYPILPYGQYARSGLKTAELYFMDVQEAADWLQVPPQAGLSPTNDIGIFNKILNDDDFYGFWLLPDGVFAYVKVSMDHIGVAHSLFGPWARKHELGPRSYDFLFCDIGAARGVFDKGSITYQLSDICAPQLRNTQLTLLANILAAVHAPRAGRRVWYGTDSGNDGFEPMSDFIAKYAGTGATYRDILGRGGREDVWEDGFTAYNPRDGVEKYTDIGHNDPKDILWIVWRGKVETAVSEDALSHVQHWGLEAVTNCWRGRFEVLTGRCSITPPEGLNSRHPPQALTKALDGLFPVREFHIFGRA